MSVWYCLPSARPIEEVNARLQKWRDSGYLIAILRDELPLTSNIGIECDLADSAQWRFGGYPGYAVAVNHLIKWVLDVDRNAHWFVIGADDIDPDPTKAPDQIAAECEEHFGALWSDAFHERKHIDRQDSRTFGVMQPTGDRWGDRAGAYIDRVAGSPWIGRTFAQRAYLGKGPYWAEYTHMGVDEELQAVASLHGVFLQRPDLTHYHDHWGRPRPGEVMGLQSRMPDFLEHANSQEHWDRYKRIFTTRQAAGFPGSELSR